MSLQLWDTLLESRVNTEVSRAIRREELIFGESFFKPNGMPYFEPAPIEHESRGTSIKQEDAAAPAEGEDESNYVLAPKCAKMVGGNKQTVEKAGCTLIVTVDLTNGKLLNPFIVLNGKTDLHKKCTLDHESSFYAGTCSVNFQKKHWFDTPITIRWLRCTPRQNLIACKPWVQG